MLKKVKKIVQKILGISLVRKLLIKTNIFILGVASSSRITSIVYHWVFFFTFSREQHANIKGKYKYYKNLNRIVYTITPLRRNIHRLEKGLSMQQLRDLFALDYIEETVEQFERGIKQYKDNADSIDRSELEWANDVLERYFATIKHNDYTKQIQERFLRLGFTSEKDVQKAPFARGREKVPPVRYEDLLSLSMRRRSVRWFQQKAVPRSLVDKALLVGRQSPTACNRLPYEFRIYDEPDLVRKIAAIPFGTGGYHQNIPMIIVVIGKQDHYFSSRDRHLIYIDSALAMMPFMLALETLGLASTSINWPDFEPLEIKMQKTLGLGIDERPIMLIGVGYPDAKGLIPYSQKKSLEGLRSFNKITSKTKKLN
jgi:nitroreductase